MKHTIVIIDSGGRGASLLAKYSQSPSVGKIIAIPGNDGMRLLTKKSVEMYPNIKTTDIEQIIQICKKKKVSLIDVAQDSAVEKGLVDRLRIEGLAVVGPTRNAGELEWNKAWSRRFMEKYHILVPKFHIFHSVASGANFLKKKKNQKWFVKASGLCEGKGALPAENNAEAIEQIKVLEKFGEAGKTYLLEEWLSGKSCEEFSAFLISDGEAYRVLGFAQDHKRALNFDEGDNTGGMGCVSRPLAVTPKIRKQVDNIARKTIEGMHKEKRVYTGVLYIGCMIVDGKVFVIEYNARWGDPEAEVILPGIRNDFYELGMAIVHGNLNTVKLQTDKIVRVSVAGCAKGYPKDYSLVIGKRVFGIMEAMHIRRVRIYSAGLRKIGKNYTVHSGRVFHMVGEGKTIIDARRKAYEAMSLMSIEGNNLFYRTDIGYHDVERMRKRTI